MASVPRATGKKAHMGSPRTSFRTLPRSPIAAPGSMNGSRDATKQTVTTIASMRTMRGHPPGVAVTRARYYSYATAMNGLADKADLRLRFDVLTKTKQPELHRYWTTRDRAASVRLYRLAAGILGAVEAGVFRPRVGWHGDDCASGGGAGRRGGPSGQVTAMAPP